MSNRFALLEQGRFTFWMLLCCLLLLVIGLYSPGLFGGFIFDDIPALSGNRLLQLGGAQFDNWRVAAFSSGAGPLSRPLTMLSFALNHAISGQLSPFAIKLTNVFIHCAIGVLLFLFFRKLLAAIPVQQRCTVDPQWCALLAASLWLLHPLHVSTVLYAVQRMAQLATLFVVLGLWIFVHYRSRWATHGGSAGSVLAAALWIFLITFLAILAKENGALLLWLVPVVEVSIFRGRWAGREQPWLVAAGWLLFLLPLLVIAAIFFTAPHIFLSGYVTRDFTLIERLLTQSRLLWQYLSWLAWPNILTMGFQHDGLTVSRGLLEPWTTLPALAAWPVVLLIAIWYRRQQPLLLFAVLFFLIAHSMESSFLALEMTYEHRNYLPSVAISLAIAVVLAAGLMKLQARPRSWLVFAGLFVMSGLLISRAYSWGDDLRFARDNVARQPESVRSHYFYASALLRQYWQRNELGLNDGEIDSYLAASRHYFEVMHQQDSANVGALVMLYYMDTRFYPELLLHADWLGALQDTLGKRPLGASDRNALVVLMDCMGSGECETPEAIARRLLQDIAHHFPGEADTASWEYTYLKASGASPEVLIPLLKMAAQQWPHRLEFHPELIYQCSLINDVDCSYSALRQWMLHDRGRRQLVVQQGLLFEDSE